MKESFILLERFQYSSEAIIYKGKLESEGIEVYMRDGNIIDSNPLYSNAVGGIKLYVKSEAAERAKIILSEISPYSVDENNQLLKCPKCNAEQIDMVTSISDIKSLLSFMFFVLLFAIPFISKHKYKCSNCKFEFN